MSTIENKSNAENTVETNVYDTPPYKRSRATYNAEALLEYLISLTLIGSAILSKIQENGNVVFGMTVYAQQFLCLISAIITVALVLYLALVIRKLKRTV